MTHKIIDSRGYGARWCAVGIFLGAIIGLGVQALIIDFLETWYPIPPDVICKNNITFEAITYGDSVYLKTNKECIETNIIE